MVQFEVGGGDGLMLNQIRVNGLMLNQFGEKGLMLNQVGHMV
jgi:hypothetical protein